MADAADDVVAAAVQMLQHRQHGWPPVQRRSSVHRRRPPALPPSVPPRRWWDWTGGCKNAPPIFRSNRSPMGLGGVVFEGGALVDGQYPRFAVAGLPPLLYTFGVQMPIHEWCLLYFNGNNITFLQDGIWRYNGTLPAGPERILDNMAVPSAVIVSQKFNRGNPVRRG